MQHLNPIEAAARNYAAQEARSAALWAHHAQLKAELLTAIQTHPGILVSTPGFGPLQSATAVWAVVQDTFAGREGDAILQDLIKLLGQRIKAGDELAASIGNRLAQQHADFHADELDQEEGDE